MEDAKEEIRARLAVEDVVGQYIELKRAGRNFKGHSPWGTDRTPSFVVSPEKGIWHDFSSNKGGDIFTFVMEMEGLTFREALEKLANQAGVELKKYGNDEKKFLEKKKRLREILELSAKYYQVCLTRNRAVCEYVFYKRNLNKKTVEKFRIGYAPKAGNAIVGFLRKRGFSMAEIEEAGMTNRFGGDLFKGRMMVPLMDVGGGVIGFTGRILDDKDKNAPKYLNTPETILYNKGRHIFGLSQAKETIRKSDFVVVVEGNMDVISSHQAGVCEAVATAGTAMTEMHLKSFARMTKDIRLAYDGDEAGVRAAERAISLASKFGIYLSVIDDYQGCKDADELIQKNKELWQKAVTRYRPAMEWILEKYTENYDLRTEKGFQEYCTEAKKLIAQIDAKDTVLREKYEKQVSERLGISLEAFRAQRFEKKVKTKRLRQVKKEAGAKSTAKINEAEKNLAALVVVGKVNSEMLGDLRAEEFNKGELELIFEEKYKTWDKSRLEEEAKGLAKRLEKDRAVMLRRDLEERIRGAEQSGDEELENQLMNELNKLIKQKK
ncbi:DNA primase [Candidatus Saccharibacteria bacterium]|nr:DNA primase [Candidatus Saccharibacteria bacterium]